MIRLGMVLLALESPATLGATVTVNLTGFKPAAGPLVATLCTEQQFNRRSCPNPVRTLAKEDHATLVFDNVPPGRYVATVYQDVNGNGRMDTDLVGRPTEPAAMSGAVTLIPTFDRAAFKVEGQAVTITLRLTR